MMMVGDDDGMIVRVGVEGGGIYWNIWMIGWVYEWVGVWGVWGMGVSEREGNINTNTNNITTIIITILII